MFVVISYDIPDDKRRLKVAKLLLDFGGERVQRSVFECHITAEHLARLSARLQRLCQTEADSVRLYFLCESCRPKAQLYGVATPTEEPGLRII